MFDRGLLTIARVRGAAVRVHWTLPFGVLLFALPRVSPGAWLGALLVLLAHAGGRLGMARARRRPTRGVRLHMFGGDGYHPGARGSDGAVIAWGGVLAQLVVAGVGAVLRGRAPDATGFGADLVQTLVGPNLVLAVIHLVVPFEPFAGRGIWRRGPGGGIRRPGGPLTSRELRRRQERAMAEGPPPDDDEIAGSGREALRKAAEDVKKKPRPG